MISGAASVTSLLELMMGGLYVPRRDSVLHSRLRYFDPVRRRAGIPADVAALVERMTDDEVTVSLVNTNQVEPRTLIVQAGSYAEHQFWAVNVDGEATPINASDFTIRLEPGSRSRLVIVMDRYANQPTLAFPWNR